MSKNILFANADTVAQYPIRNMKRFAESLWNGSCSYDGLGVVYVYGALGNGTFDSYFGTSYSDISRCLETQMQDESVKAVLIAINSPGGMVQGLMELCAYIKKCSAEKPIYAYIDGEACSAAYAIATSCNEVWSTMDSITGCCGCYAHVIEESEQAYKDAGFLHKVFRSKNAPRKNLSVITNEEEAKAYQDEIDHWGNEYLKLVASNRNIELKEAEKTFGQGAVVIAQYAIENKMIDAIGSIEECTSKLIGSLISETEGDDMDITKLSASEQTELYAQLIGTNPSLVSEHDENVRTAERDRVKALESLRDGSDAVNALVDAAVADGKSAQEISLDVIKAMKDNKQPNAEDALKALGENTTVVETPLLGEDGNPYLKAAAELNKEDK